MDYEIYILCQEQENSETCEKKRSLGEGENYVVGVLEAEAGSCNGSLGHRWHWEWTKDLRIRRSPVKINWKHADPDNLRWGKEIKAAWKSVDDSMEND